MDDLARAAKIHHAEGDDHVAHGQGDVLLAVDHIADGRAVYAIVSGEASQSLARTRKGLGRST